MPVYEYQCNKCNNKFELLVRTNLEEISCPDCHSLKVNRLFSTFASFSKDSKGNISSSSGCSSCASHNCSTCGR
ncbi:MAG: zinc ribbon domain-containing protein [Candidatus Omnitrophota bacterium]|nr:zinc ribbon domain-containing protein [Candidatus Omnitrophota bacterium]MBU1871401.1 zinc ribbon domain-containing protein [Candidatus Omnitrophota bacterium]